MNFKLTLTLVVLLVVICCAYFFIPARKPAAGPGEEAAKMVLSPRPKGLKEITFSRDGEKQVAFARGEKGWELTYPVQAAAESWQIDSIADSLAGLSYTSKFAADASGFHSAEATGTGKPEYVVAFTDDAGKNFTLGLGKRTVGGIYGTLDGGKTVYLLAGDPLGDLDKPADSFRDKSIKSIDTAKIDRLKFMHAGATVTLKRTGDKWMISKPVNGRANAEAVTAALAELKAINATGFTDMAKDSAATGLNPPQASVTAFVESETAKGEGGEPAKGRNGETATGPASAPALTPVTLQLGYYTDLTDKKDVYASLAGSKQVFTLAATSADKLNRELQDLRDPAISPADIGDATGATLTTDGQVVVKVEKMNDKWTLDSASVPVAAGNLEVGNWLGDLRNLRAIKFVDDAGDLKSIGLDPPKTRIELTIPDQSQHEVIFVGKPETADKVTPMMRQGEPTVYLVQSADAAAIMQNNLTLRDKTIERLSADEIRGINVSGKDASGGGFDLVRKGTTWDVKSGGKSVNADDDKITELLADFTPLTAAKYVSEKAEGAEGAGGSVKPDLTVTLEVSEPVANPATTRPAKGPAAKKPNTAPATLPTGLTAAPAGPVREKSVRRVLKLFKSGEGKTALWTAVWDGAAPQWTFEPTPALLEHLTKESYAAKAATQPATEPTTQPAK